MRIEEDETMVSFDVVSLFTSIPQDLAVKTIHDLLHRKLPDNTQDNLRPEDLVELLKVSLTVYFTFQGVMYEQIKGTPMGSPISSVIAEAVLQQVEHVAMTQLRPKFWARYVDDTFVVIKKSHLAKFIGILNSVCTDIQFTVEEERQGKLAFLDVLVHRQEDGTLHTNVFRKSTHTDRILHYDSNHPMSHKIGCIRSLFSRIGSHCNTASAKAEEERHLFQVFKRNGYPIGIVKKFCTPSQLPSRQHSPDSNPPTTRVALPYIRGISEATARVLAPYGIKVAHRPAHTLRSQIMRPKDPLPTCDKSNVIYKIPCGDCPAHYIGETSKCVSSRIQEHKLAIKRGEPYSQLWAHMMGTGHSFNFDGVQVVGADDTKSGRLLKEAWLSSDASINRHVELCQAHVALRAWGRHQQRQHGFCMVSSGHLQPDGDHLERNPTTARPSDTPSYQEDCGGIELPHGAADPVQKGGAPQLGNEDNKRTLSPKLGRRQKDRVHGKIINIWTPPPPQKKDVIRQDTRNHRSRHPLLPEEKNNVPLYAAQRDNKDGCAATPLSFSIVPDPSTSLNCQFASSDELETLGKGNSVCGSLEPNHPPVRSPVTNGNGGGGEEIRIPGSTTGHSYQARDVDVGWVPLIRDSTAHPHGLLRNVIPTGNFPMRIWTDLNTEDGNKSCQTSHKEAIDHLPHTSALDLLNGEVRSWDDRHERRGRAMTRSNAQRRSNEKPVGSPGSLLSERTPNLGDGTEIQSASPLCQNNWPRSLGTDKINYRPTYTKACDLTLPEKTIPMGAMNGVPVRTIKSRIVIPCEGPASRTRSKTCKNSKSNENQTAPVNNIEATVGQNRPVTRAFSRTQKKEHSISSTFPL